MKRIYLVLVIVLSLATLCIYSTYAMFTAGVETEGFVNMDSILNYEFEINGNQEFTIDSASTLRFNAVVKNNMTSTISYGLYYRMIDGVKTNDIIIAEITDSNLTTSGGINSNESITIPIVIKNNTNDSIKVEIGVRTGYYNSSTNEDDIIYGNGEVLITETMASSDAPTSSCSASLTGDCEKKCEERLEDGYVNTYCWTSCTTNGAESLDSSRLAELDDSGANTPELFTGLIPITYYNGNWVKADSIDKNSVYKWYDYNAQKWANAVLVTDSSRATYVSASAGTTISESDVLAYYVWIPRYKYKVWNINKVIGTDSYNAQMTGIDIIFEKGTISTGTINCTYDFTVLEGNGLSETCTGSNGDYYTHPAFTLGDTELRGIWFSKFQLSSSNPQTGSALGGGNSISLGVRVKPNVVTWHGNKLSNYYYVIDAMNNVGNEYGLSNDSDSHMMRNMEWASVAYLTYSKYGLCSNGTCKSIGKNAYKADNYYGFITGCGEASTVTQLATECNAYDTSTGMLASTTGNIYGVYDMDWGNNEYTMARSSNTAGTFIYEIISIDGDNFQYNNQTAKYVDTYAYGTTNNNQTAYNRARLGDATGEVMISSTRAWYNAFLRFPSGTGYGTIYIRSGTNTGIFGMESYNGLWANNFSTRAVLTAS